MEQVPTELHFITFNCWGLPRISRHRHERLIAIGRQLAVADPVPHIVGLQECWTREDYLAIRRQTRATLPYGKFYHGGIFGSGLAILSRWPLEESTMIPYSLNGRPTAFFRGDWYVGKGIACAKIRYGPHPKDIIEVLNTHMHAKYGDAPKSADYLVHRLSQAWEMAKLIRGAADRGHLVVAMGDFNDVPGSLPHHLLCAHAPVRDVWRALHPDSALGAAEDDVERARRRPLPSAHFNMNENGVTHQSVFNSWQWAKTRRQRRPRRTVGLDRGDGEDAEQGSRQGSDEVVPPGETDMTARRIDYILASSGPLPHMGENTGWVVKDASVGMLERHPDLQCSLSDHFSVHATLALHQIRSSSGRSSPATSLSPTAQGAALDRGTYLSSPAPSIHGLPPTSARDDGTTSSAQTRAELDEQLRQGAEPPPRLPGSVYDSLLELVGEGMRRAHTQQRWRAAHACFWYLYSVAAFVAVWFVGAGGGPFALLVIGTLGCAVGSIDGLIALLFFGAEMRALKEFEWEIRNAKAAATGSGGWADDEKDGGEWS